MDMNSMKMNSMNMKSMDMDDMDMMDMENMNLCQSCGMPMKDHMDFGTNEDGSMNNNYCTHMMVEMNMMPEKEAKEMNMKLIPNLKRWMMEKT
jgi:hypothetical protein